RLGLEHDELGAYRHHVSRRARGRDHAATYRCGHLDRRLLGHDLDHHVVLGDDITGLHAPADDLRLDRALAQIRQLEDVAAHCASITSLRAAAMRAWPGKYSHSNACGEGVSQPATRFTA